MNVFRDAWSYLANGASWTSDGGIIQRGIEQLLVTFTALGLVLLIGLPIALWLGHLGRFGFLAINISNIGRAVPTFALLAVLVKLDWPGTDTIGPYGRGGLATLIALTLFSLPPIITNAYVAMREVPTEITQAADGMGMTGWQKFRRVELPLATPLVMSGIRLALVQLWATATIAALVAGPGLGRIVTDAFARTQYGKGLAGALVIAVLALVLELLAATAQRVLDPTPSAPAAKASPNRDEDSEQESPSLQPDSEVSSPHRG